MSCQSSVAQALASIRGRQTVVEAWPSLPAACRRRSLPAAACRSLPQLHLRPFRPPILLHPAAPHTQLCLPAAPHLISLASEGLLVSLASGRAFLAARHLQSATPWQWLERSACRVGMQAGQLRSAPHGERRRCTAAGCRLGCAVQKVAAPLTATTTLTSWVPSCRGSTSR